MRLFEDSQYWTRVNDGNPVAFDIFTRHYSFRKWRRRNGINGKRIAGPGQTILLLGKDNKALCVWKVQKYRLDGQEGIENCIFRNENKNNLSSAILLEAMEVAKLRWPGLRFFTYVNTEKIKSTNPGCCYKKAGWSQCGESKEGLLIFEKTIF